MLPLLHLDDRGPQDNTPDTAAAGHRPSVRWDEAVERLAGRRTGVGKTWLAWALAQQACRTGTATPSG
ncbi:MAG: ATP-binding protein [Chromatiaceae bacterium]|nr:ATP-binding protein [Chromatiaceae bacterium]